LARRSSRSRPVRESSGLGRSRFPPLGITQTRRRLVCALAENEPGHGQIEVELSGLASFYLERRQAFRNQAAKAQQQT
jgi:hypothetical protein